MVFAAVTRGSWSARLARCSVLERGRVSEVFRGLPIDPLLVKDPSERILLRSEKFVSVASFDAAQHRLTTLVQPDGRTSLWGANSFAALPPHAEAAHPHAGEQIRHRKPALKSFLSALDSGIWLAVADRDGARTAPGAPRGDEYEVVINGDEDLFDVFGKQ